MLGQPVGKMLCRKLPGVYFLSRHLSVDRVNDLRYYDLYLWLYNLRASILPFILFGFIHLEIFIWFNSTSAYFFSMVIDCYILYIEYIIHLWKIWLFLRRSCISFGLVLTHFEDKHNDDYCWAHMSRSAGNPSFRSCSLSLLADQICNWLTGILSTAMIHLRAK